MPEPRRQPLVIRSARNSAAIAIVPPKSSNPLSNHNHLSQQQQQSPQYAVPYLPPLDPLLGAYIWGEICNSAYAFLSVAHLQHQADLHRPQLLLIAAANNASQFGSGTSSTPPRLDLTPAWRARAASYRDFFGWFHMDLAAECAELHDGAAAAGHAGNIDPVLAVVASRMLHLVQWPHDGFDPQLLVPFSDVTLIACHGMVTSRQKLRAARAVFDGLAADRGVSRTTKTTKFLARADSGIADGETSNPEDQLRMAISPLGTLCRMLLCPGRYPLATASDCLTMALEASLCSAWSALSKGKLPVTNAPAVNTPELVVSALGSKRRVPEWECEPGMFAASFRSSSSGSSMSSSSPSSAKSNGTCVRVLPGGAARLRGLWNASPPPSLVSASSQPGSYNSTITSESEIKAESEDPARRQLQAAIDFLKIPTALAPVPALVPTPPSQFVQTSPMGWLAMWQRLGSLAATMSRPVPGMMQQTLPIHQKQQQQQQQLLTAAKISGGRSHARPLRKSDSLLSSLATMAQ
ncbi:hypothetical protein BC828DRAFT_373749 [Blastocladiella britannica]|nr:hypothetical protein BC828DRAFT_373749 [Blastocladiella britannica]